MLTLVRLPSCAAREVDAEVVKTALNPILPAQPMQTPAVSAATATPGPSRLQTLAGLGGRRWAGIGALAGGALGALMPGRDEDGEKRSPLTGALRGAVGGGLAGGLGGMAAKRMWGPTGVMKNMAGAEAAGHNVVADQARGAAELAGSAGRISQGLGKGVYDPSGREALQHVNPGMSGPKAFMKRVLPVWAGGESGFNINRAKAQLSMHRQNLLAGDVAQGLAGPAAPAAPAASAAPAAVAAEAPAPPAPAPAPQAPEAGPQIVHPGPQNPRHAEQLVREGYRIENGQWVKKSTVIVPTDVFNPLKKAAARRPFSAPKQSVAERVQGAFAPRKTKTDTAPAPAAEPPKAPKPAEAETPADDKKTAAPATPSATALPGPGPASAVAPLKTAEPTPVAAAAPAAEPAKAAEAAPAVTDTGIKTIKLAALTA